MKYLIDTHVLLWAIGNSKELWKKALAILKDQNNDIYVSSVSLWEIAIKTRLGKLHIEGIQISDLLTIIENLEFELLSMTAEDALGYCTLKENTHKDPFDRMLIWQSITRDIALISRDSQFTKFIPDGIKLVW